MGERIETEEQARKAEMPYTSRWTNAPHDGEFCCATVFGGVHAIQCTKKPKYWYGSLGYCGTHDPEKKRLKREERDAKWRAKWAAQDRYQKKAEAERLFKVKCVEAVEKIAAGHNDPRSLCADLLASRQEDERSTD